MKFINENMKFKCSKCGFECMHIAEAFEHRDYDNNWGCGGLILTPETIEEYNKYLDKESIKQYNKRLSNLKEEIKFGFLKFKKTKNGLDVIRISESEFYGKNTRTTFIPDITKEKYIDLHCQGVSDMEM